MNESGGARATGAQRVRTIHAIVSGRVQGVGFRWSCREQAEFLGLVGEVRNLPDGTVEVLAQGPSDQVARLIVWLYKGPRWSEVADVAVTNLGPGTLRLNDFQARG